MEHPCTTCPIMVAEGDCGSRCEPLSDALFGALDRLDVVPDPEELRLMEAVIEAAHESSEWHGCESGRACVSHQLVDDLAALTAYRAGFDVEGIGEYPVECPNCDAAVVVIVEAGDYEISVVKAPNDA